MGVREKGKWEGQGGEQETEGESNRREEEEERRMKKGDKEQWKD